jgi:MOSC domain-containing protein YiiM
MAKHLNQDELEAGLAHILQSPRDRGVLEAIVIRPATDARQPLQQAELSPEQGLHGDRWVKGGATRPDGRPDPDMQLTLMNARTIALIAGEPTRWPLAGDNLYVDLDLSDDNLPPGTRLRVGTALLEVSAAPHTGCNKFAARFGLEATRFVNSREGKRLHLRGINAKVLEPGTVTVGDLVHKLP